jgi:glycosyltransferase involved in cell wall biosynthesis
VGPDAKGRSLKVLMCINSLPMGGAEVLFVRLAHELARRGVSVVVFVHRKTNVEAWLRSQLRGIAVVFGPFSGRRSYRVFYKLSLTLQRALPRFSLVETTNRVVMRLLHAWHKFDVCNGHLTSSELQACMAFASSDIAIIGTDHGSYRLAPPAGDPSLAPVYARSDGLICPSLFNLQVVSGMPWHDGCLHFHIPYGYRPVREAEPPRDRPPEAPFVFGMVARGIPEKGWSEAVRAFAAVRRTEGDRVRLVLVGEGPAIDELRRSGACGAGSGVELAGFREDVEDLIAGFDVGVLPTYYRHESTPNSLVECLAKGKPMIAADTAGIREMLECERGAAGIVVGIDHTGRADVGEIEAAMRRLLNEPELLAEFRQRAALAYRKFDMDQCVDRYIAAFEQVIAARREALSP